jgi:hypothetical protein
MSNFPKYVAIYRPAENGYQVLFIDGGKFQVLTSEVSGGVWYNVGKSKNYPQDDCFQVVRPAGPDGKEVYYWPTGFDLVRNVPKSWPKGPQVSYPIFQFLTPPVGLGLTVIPAVSSGEMNAAWASAMKVIRAAALLEHREFKDMPPLVSNHEVPLVPSPVEPALDDNATVALEPSEGTYWASLDILLNSAKSIWWNGWREAGPFRKRVRVLHLDMLEPIEFLHYLRLVSSINRRTDSSGGNKIALKFTAEEVEKMRTVKTDVAVRDEIVSIMSQYTS